MTSELVNRAILISQCEADDIMGVVVRREAGFLVISVHVPDARVDPQARAAADQEADVLGLRVVRHLADRWGLENPDGLRMWAALPAGST
ncbi:MAG TPA: hypothetical protein VG186_11385 [Solirubrobacteraceae bacterium]|nr:hypothetical protein [Solirubrobacteraceae bacterium]